METEASGHRVQPRDGMDAPGSVQHLVDPSADDESVRARKQLSPLRYPGGKRKLVPYVQAVLKANGLCPDVFVEPFAGGASVALELAATRAVAQIGLADRDPYIAAFWETVFFDCDWLCRQVEEIEVTLETWERMKKTRFRSRRSLALACLFLNRTSFNGTLQSRAGPIGGKSQVSRYAIDCRFPRKRLIKRLRACEQLATEQRVAFVEAGSALNIIGRECLVRRTSGGSALLLSRSSILGEEPPTLSLLLL